MLNKKKWLQKLALFVTSHAKSILIFSILTALVSGLYALKFLKIDTNEDNLISSRLEYQQRYLEFLDEFGDWESFFVVFEVPEGKKQRAKQALSTLVSRIQNRPEYFTKIIDREDLSLFDSRALLLLSSKDFDQLLQKLPDFLPLIQKASTWQNLVPVLEEMNLKLSASTSELKKNANDLEVGFEFIKQLLAGLHDPKSLKNLSSRELLQPLVSDNYQHDEEGYFFSQSEKLLYLRVMPVKKYETMAVVEEPLRFMRSEIGEVQKLFPDITIGLTGRPVLSADQMDSTGADSVLAFVASLIGVSLLYMVYLRRFKRPLIIVGCLIIGMLWSIGFVTLTIGHLNLLTLVFTIILVGIGVDYGMHLLIRAMREQETGGARPGNASTGGAEQGEVSPVYSSIIKSGQGIVTGAVSTIAAFMTALAADFLGLQELGFVSGSGVFFCLVAMLVTLPAALTLWDEELSGRSSPVTNKKIEKQAPLQKIQKGEHGYGWFFLNYPRLVLGVIALLTLLALPLLTKIHFENNLLKLQDDSLESVRYEQKILDDSGLSAWFATMKAKNREELWQLAQKVQKLKTVGQTDSLFTVIPFDQNERIEKLTPLSQQLDVNSDLKISSNPNFEALKVEVKKLQTQLEQLQSLAFEAGEIEAVEKIDTLVMESQQALKKMTPATALEAQGLFLNFIHSQIGWFKTNLSPKPLAESDLPSSILDRYRGSKKGEYILYVYPEENIWEPQVMEKFVSELRSVHPQVAGAPINVYESSWRMTQGFYRVALLTGILVVIFMFVDFKSMKDAIVALVPLLAGLTWLGIAMAWIEIPLSLGNFFALPILVGLGIDNGVHLMHGYRDTGSIKKMLQTIGPAVTLSTLTTLIGFGALSFISHKGLASFGQIMSLGSLTCLAASFILVPVILKVLYPKTAVLD